MRHDRPRLVAHAPTGGDQPPHEVDVLAEPERFVEATAQLDRPAPHGEACGRHVRYPAAGHDSPSVGPHVERRHDGLVTSHEPGTVCRSDPRGYRPYERVGEMTQQDVEPTGNGHAIRIQEHDDGGVDRSPAGIARGGRAAVGVPADHAVRAGSHGVLRRVVDDHDV